MKFLRWSVLVVLGIVIALIAAGCSETTGGGGTNVEQNEGQEVEQIDGQEQELVIGMITINQEALFFAEMVKGAQEEADAQGVKLVVYNPNNDPVAQNNAVEDFLQQGVDALIINAIDVNGIIPAMEKAKEAGVPVISVDSIVDSDAVDVQIGVNNRAASAVLGEFFNEFVTKNWDGRAKLGVVGALNSFIQIERQNGFLEVVEESPGVEVVDIVDGENVQEKALRAAENLITGNPDLQAVFATGEPALIGTVASVRSQGRENDVKVFGWDLSKQVIEGIQEGWVAAVVQQHPDEYGRQSVLAAVKLAKGEKVPENIDVPPTIVTQDNVDEFTHLFE